MHSEVTKYRRFSPLPSMRGMNVRMPNLPPFLPPPLMEDEWNVNDEGGTSSGSSSNNMEATATKKEVQKSKKNTNAEEESSKEDTNNNNHHHHLWDPFQSFGTISSAYRSWLEGYELRNKQSYQQRRIRTEEQLLELKKKESNSTTTNNGDVGYALVTGASSGIVSFFFFGFINGYIFYAYP